MLVLLAAYVARGRARGAEGVVRALIAAAVILVPQPTGPTLVLLGNPDHIGSGVPVLVLLLLLDWARPRWWVPVAAGALLAWSIIGDPLIEVAGSVPLFAACALRAWWKIQSRAPGESSPPESARSPRPGRRAWSVAWYELSLAAAAVASVPLAAAGNWLIRALGGMNVAHSWYTLQSVREIIRGLPVVWQSVLTLFGADYEAVHGAENVAFALQVIGKPRHNILTTVPDVLDMVGLAGKEKRRPHELSGGEQQRVAIARAFVNRPDILLADEPTGNLDPTTSLGIMRLLDRINRTGTTVVMATHDDEIVDQMRKRVVELETGTMVRDQSRGVYGSDR